MQARASTMCLILILCYTAFSTILSSNGAFARRMGKSPLSVMLSLRATQLSSPWYGGCPRPMTEPGGPRCLAVRPCEG